MTLTHKEMTAHIRQRIKIAGIKATVRMQKICGDKKIQVNTIACNKEFAHEEQRLIRQIAKNNNLTAVCHIAIDIARMTNPYHFNFYYNV